MSIAHVPLQPDASNAQQMAQTAAAPVSFMRLALWTLLFQLAWNAQKLPAIVRDGAMPDPDDFLRLDQIRSWLAGQNWFDVSVARMNPPLGGDMHWSRLVDVPVALLIKLFEPFAGALLAERLAAVVWPTILLVATVLVVAAICERLLPGVNKLLALMFTVTCLPAVVEFAPGRIDHHNVQIFLFTLILLGLVNRDRYWGHALIGAGVALSAAVGIDALLVLLAILIFLGLEWALGNDPKGKGLALTAASLAASALILYIATVPAKSWFDARPDAYSILFLYAFLLIAAGFVTLSLLSRIFAQGGAFAIGLRLFAGLAIAAPCLALLYIVFPESFNGRFGGISEELNRRWLSQIMEAQGLPAMIARQPAHWISTLAYLCALSFAGLYALTQLHNRSANKTNVNNLIALYAVMLLSFAATFVQFRLLRIGIFASIPISVVFVAIVWKKIDARSAGRDSTAAALTTANRTRHTLLKTLAIVVLMAPFWLALSLLTGSSNAAMQSAAGNSTDQNNQSAMAAKPQLVAAKGDWRSQPIYAICNKQSQFAALAALPKSQVINDLNSGPSILIFTHHAILAGNYHRNGSAILNTMNFFETNMANARKILGASRARYVVYCDPGKPLVPTAADKQKLAWHILSGKPPNWLKRISSPKDRLIILEIIRPK